MRSSWSPRTTPIALLLFALPPCALCLNQSDGYNIGVILGSIIAALIAIGIAAFIFYACCVKDWISPNDPKLAFVRHEESARTKPKKPPPQSQPTTTVFGPTSASRGSYTVRGAGAVAPKETARRGFQEPEDYPRSRGAGGGVAAAPQAPRPHSDERPNMVSIAGSKNGPPGGRYGAGGEYSATPGPVVLSDEGRNNSSVSYTTSESELRAAGVQRSGAFEAQRVYHQETTAIISAGRPSGAGTSAPPPQQLSAAYLGTGV